MKEIIISFIVFIGVVFVGLYAFAKWATSTTFIGCDSKGEKNEQFNRYIK